MRLRLGLFLLMLASSVGCGSSSSGPTMGPSGGTGNGTPVSIVPGSSSLTTTAYAPNPVNVAPGSTVTWTNNDTTSHTSTANDGAWDSGSIPPGGSFSRMFPNAGTFTYRCTIHPGM